MSMELFIFLALDVPLGTNNLNEVAKNLEPRVVYEENVNLSKHSGFLPVTLRGSKSGVETYSIDYSSLENYLPKNENLSSSNTKVLQLRWGSSPEESVVAFYTASLFSTHFNGVVFDPMSGVYLNENQVGQALSTFSEGPE
ncbi:hypothetical protein ACJJIK_04475 [Microbulbifer sp. ZKSA006]|uniref:hypothetical protein n=1 Tax=Microbulbifer sp. ZKSA006 TaxID=3243390 RepID=UPI00403A7365